MRADFRGFGDDRQIDVPDMTIARRDALAGKGKEAVRSRAAPLRIAGREVVADIPVRQGAEDSVGDRVKRNVGIAMPFGANSFSKRAVFTPIERVSR